ncbi:ABC transporter substrate-binding protein [Methylocapsa sp. S129]|uniref:substrate-binding periplasmic protein n=1 Tax=Methylocapsa sp. S129 TaxID=1641869 RepID=UPI00131B1020|nr:ABC transporter substrate-binding protein [Methylocapsa sp. S129]
MARKCKTTLLAALSAMLSLVAWQGALADDLLSTARSKHEITIGTSNDAPLSFIDSKDNSATGVLPDVLRAALAKMGVKTEVRVVAMPFSSLIPALTSGRIDMIGDAMYATAARKQIIDFTEISFYNPESLDVAKGNPGKLHSLADLCGKIAGTYEGTTYIDMLRKASAACPAGKTIDVRQYPTIQNVFADLSAGRLDAAVVDSTLSAYALKENLSLSFELVADYKPEDKQGSGCAFGVAKGSEDFLKSFNETYSAMLADGSAAKLFTKWGLTPTAFFLAP